MDHAEIITKLRDIHLPVEQSLINTVISSILGSICAIILFKSIIHFNSSLYPIRDAALKSLENSRLLNSNERLAAQSRLLRVVAQSIDAKLSFQKGDAWLAQLDSIFATNFFTHGQGKIFGESLYQKTNLLPLDNLDRELEILLLAFKK